MSVWLDNIDKFSRKRGLYNLYKVEKGRFVQFLRSEKEKGRFVQFVQSRKRGLYKLYKVQKGYAKISDQNLFFIFFYITKQCQKIQNLKKYKK